MHHLLEAIRCATGDGATADQKADGARACRTILTALEAEAGKPLALPAAPQPNPLAGFDLTQALDFLIARLRQTVPPEDPTPASRGRSAQPGLRLELVRPPAAAQRRK